MVEIVEEGAGGSGAVWKTGALPPSRWEEAPKIPLKWEQGGRRRKLARNHFTFPQKDVIIMSVEC